MMLPNQGSSLSDNNVIRSKKRAAPSRLSTAMTRGRGIFLVVCKGCSSSVNYTWPQFSSHIVDRRRKRAQIGLPPVCDKEVFELRVNVSFDATLLQPGNVIVGCCFMVLKRREAPHHLKNCTAEWADLLTTEQKSRLAECSERLDLIPPPARAHPCGIGSCTATFGAEVSRIYHVVLTHYSSKIYGCPCGMAVPNPRHWKAHVATCSQARGEPPVPVDNPHYLGDEALPFKADCCFARFPTQGGKSRHESQCKSPFRDALVTDTELVDKLEAFNRDYKHELAAVHIGIKGDRLLQYAPDLHALIAKPDDDDSHWAAVESELQQLMQEPPEPVLGSQQMRDLAARAIQTPDPTELRFWNYSLFRIPESVSVVDLVSKRSEDPLGIFQHCFYHGVTRSSPEKRMAHRLYEHLRSAIACLRTTTSPTPTGLGTAEAPLLVLSKIRIWATGGSWAMMAVEAPDLDTSLQREYALIVLCIRAGIVNCKFKEPRTTRWSDRRRVLEAALYIHTWRIQIAKHAASLVGIRPVISSRLSPGRFSGLKEWAAVAARLMGRDEEEDDDFV